MADMQTPLRRVRGLGSARGGTAHFWRVRVTSVALVPLSLFAIWLVLATFGSGYLETRAMLAHPVVAILLGLFVVITLDHMLRRFTRIVRALVVHPDRMRENLERSRGVIFSGTVLLELAQRGVSREQAYTWVQRAAMRSHDERLDFKDVLAADPDVMGVLSRDDLDRAFDLDQQLRHVGPLVDRVLSDTAVASRSKTRED